MTIKESFQDGFVADLAQGLDRGVLWREEYFNNGRDGLHGQSDGGKAAEGLRPGQVYLHLSENEARR